MGRPVPTAPAFRMRFPHRLLLWVGSKPRFVGNMYNATGWAFRRMCAEHGLWGEWRA